jgi:hypothetical protein
MEKQSIKEMFEQFFTIEKPIRDFGGEARWLFLRELGSHPNFTLKIVKEVLEAKGNLNVEQFRWIFSQLNLDSQIKTIKEVLETDKYGVKHCLFDRAVLKAVDEMSILYWLNIRGYTALGWMQVLLQRGIFYSENLGKFNWFNRRAQTLLIILFLEAATTENNPIKSFFDNLDKEKKGTKFFWVESPRDGGEYASHNLVTFVHFWYGCK